MSKRKLPKLYVEVEVRSADSHWARAILPAQHESGVFEEDGVPVINHEIDAVTDSAMADVIEKTLSINRFMTL